MADYQYYEKVENGDLNWIIPDKLLAFSTPVDSADADNLTFSPDYYVPIFKKLGVTMVIRLNSKEYNSEVRIKITIFLEIYQKRNKAHRIIF